MTIDRKRFRRVLCAASLLFALQGMAEERGAAARQYLAMLENFAGFAEQRWNEKGKSYELVDHPLRWVEVENFMSKPDAKQTAAGEWTIDGKLRVRVIGGTHGEPATDGINGAVRRDFTAKAGDVLQDSVCVYQPLVPGRAASEVRQETDALHVAGCHIRRDADGALVIKGEVRENPVPP